ncbi:MAG: hypothetical protein A3J83_03560 [Elusimicrobia bacterium RIFOXYA2_FULL_40_6]|nr:MAG: hypothetical protein A3J83_03560 [Elusimicrobia bacterium RIFOXYA2_FULL_40_6]
MDALKKEVPIEFKTDKQIAEEVFGDLPDLPKKEASKSQFCKIPHWITDTGVLEVMRPKAVKMLINLARHANYTTGIGRIGNIRISKKCDIHSKSVSSYFIRDLISFGIIKTWRNGWVRYYQIQWQPPSDVQEHVEFFRKIKLPKNSDTYLRDSKTGKFVGDKTQESTPKNSDIPSP